MSRLSDALIAHYKMNENTANAVVVDETGNHNGEYQLNSVAQNTDTGASTGKINGALDFVGGANGEHIEIADHTDFSPGDGSTGTPSSISAWVYMHDATDFTIVTKYALGANEWVFDVYTDDKLYFFLVDESTNGWIGRACSSVLTSYEDQWIHLVATYDGSKVSSGIKLYLNSLRVDDADEEDGTFDGVENLGAAVTIGKEEADYADGLIDNVMFFSVELTQDEVMRLCNNGHGTEILAEIDSRRFDSRNRW